MKKLLLAIGLWLVSATAGYCQGTIPVALTQQSDANGKPLAGALLFTFIQGTVAQQQSTFQDSGLTILNPWPLQADQSGRIPMFYMASGSTHVRLTDSSGVVQFDIPNMLVIGPAGGGGGGSGSIDPTTIMQTGDIKARYGIGILSGFVRCNGLTIGSAVSGATERANSDTQNLFVYLYNTDPNLAVSGGRTGNALNDFNANKTITLPDWRGRTIVALADMGNSATSVLTSTFAGASVTTLGGTIGSQSHTLVLAELPTGITAAGTNAINVSGSNSFSASGVNSISVTLGTSVVEFGGAFFGSVQPGTGGGIDFNSPSPTTGFPTSSGNNNIAVSGSITINSSGSNTISTTSNNTSGAAHAVVMPGLLATIYVKL